MSLFPDDYPGDQPTPTSPGPHRCCDAWAEFIAQDDTHVHLVWTVLHRFAHGRLPFTLDAIAERAGIDPDEALAALDSAIERGWVGPASHESYMSGWQVALYQGCLTRWR